MRGGIMGRLKQQSKINVIYHVRIIHFNIKAIYLDGEVDCRSVGVMLG